MSGVFIVQIYFNQDMWLAPWTGDPGRTCVKDSARQYKTKRGAKIALGMAQKQRRLPYAKIKTVYPCAKCGTLRTKEEGGTTLTVCDDCWDKQ